MKGRLFIRALAVLAAAAPVRLSLAEDKPRVIKPPELLKFVEAPFPETEIAAQKGAVVVLEIAIAADGKVADARVLESAGPAFDQAAVEAARQFEFTPATSDGAPIPVKIAYRYEFVWKEELIQRTTADFEGVVRDRKTKTPLASVTVQLDSGQSVVTDEQGRFAIKDVAPGDRSVTLSGPRLKAIGTQESFEASKKLDAVYEVDLVPEKKGDEEEDEYEIEVRAPRVTKQIVSTEIAAAEGRKVPGTQGDVLKVVENLPGVGRSAVGSGQLVVWGAAPQDTRVYVDGMRIPLLYHNGGFRSVLHSDLVRSVELSPGGYGAPYGRGIGGLVAVRLKQLDEDAFHGSVSADFYDVAGSVRAPIGDRLNAAIAFRRSHLDELLPLVSSKDVGDIVPIPRYYDGQARLQYRLGADETIELGGLFSSDQIDHNLIELDPADTKRNSKTIRFGRGYVRYEKKMEDGTVISVVPSFGLDDSSDVSRFGSIPTELDVSSTLYAFRADYRSPIRDWLTMTLGLDAELISSRVKRLGSISSPPREGDVRVFGEPPSDQINVDTWTTVIGSAAPYAEADFSFFSDALHVVPGLRLEPYFVSGNRSAVVVGDNPSLGFSREDTIIEPRISIRYAITPEITTKAAFGIYHQAPLPEDLSASFGNPLLGIATARHFLGGGALRFTPQLSAELTGFYSESEDLAIRSAAENPLTGQSLVQNGKGRSYGGQVLVRQERIGGFFGWLSYSLIRSERSDIAGTGYRLFDFDQTHVLTAVAAYDFGSGWDVGLRVRYASGFPRTPVIGAFYDARLDAYYPLFGAQNSVRIPDFFQLDLRAAKRFKIDQSELEVFLDVQNATNHSNPEEIVYNFNFTRKGYITGLPALPVVGARWSW
jgi:TonB family protein